MKQTIYKVTNPSNKYFGSLFVPNIQIDDRDVQVIGWVSVPYLAGGSITHEDIWMNVADLEVYAEHEVRY